MNQPHVDSDLLAYLDGELDAAARDRVEAHLAGCPQCADELAELRRLRAELRATFPAALTPVRLPAAADRRIREQLRTRTERPRAWWALWQWRGVAAQVTLTLLVLFFVINTSLLPSAAPAVAAPPETLVLGQTQFAPGSQAALRVVVRQSGAATPVPGAEVSVSLAKAPGLAKLVYQGRTGTDGTAPVAFTVPADLEGAAELVVETRAPGGDSRISRPVTIARRVKLYLNSDKPAYRPGQTLHLRALALDAVTFQPVASAPLVLEWLDAAGQLSARRTVTTSEFGIAALDFTLPATVPTGTLTLRATLSDTVAERAVVVDTYELPAFRVTWELGRAFYGPGERVTGTVEAAYFFGQPVAGAAVTLRGYTTEPQPALAAEVTGQTDAQGRLAFAFNLPVGYGRETAAPRPFTVELSVTDTAGQRVGLRRELAITDPALVIKAIPESGRLKPGVENRLFILAATPDGQPTAATLRVTVNGQTSELATDAYGLAVLRFTPPPGSTQITLLAQGADGTTGHADLTLTAESQPQTLLLRTEQAAYTVGETLRAEALTGAVGQTVYLDVVHAGQTVAALAAPAQEGRATFALDLDGTLVGTVELHAYALLADGSRVEDTRLVMVDPPQRVAVTVTADQARYHPGETAHVQVQTTLSPTGEITPTVLGISVVDESVYALETLPPGFVRAYLLLEKELLARRSQALGLDLPALTSGEAALRAAQDTAAQAAWAGASGTAYTLSARATAVATPAPARTARASALGWLVALLPLLLAAAVVNGLRPTGLLGPALRRTGWGLLAFFLAAPCLLAALFASRLALRVAQGIFLAALAATGLLLLALLIHGWRRRDVRVQLATGLLGTYLALGSLLVVTTGRALSGPLAGLIAVAHLLALGALVLLSQGLVLDGKRIGWLAALLAFLLALLALLLPTVVDSTLTRAVGNPVLYAGPAGWLSGCGTAPTEPPPAQAPATEAPATTEALVEVTAAPTSVPLPTATPVTPAVEPYPLRQLFPETLYWAAEAHTDAEGRLALDLPLADNLTTWRLTALASTQAGELGVATYDLVVFKEFFVALTPSATVAVAQPVTVTLTLYNYLPQAQTVRLTPVPADWYTLLTAPEPVTLAPNAVATATFTLRPERAGTFSLRVDAAGERMSDAVAVEVAVGP